MSGNSAEIRVLWNCQYAFFKEQGPSQEKTEDRRQRAWEAVSHSPKTLNSMRIPVFISLQQAYNALLSGSDTLVREWAKKFSAILQLRNSSENRGDASPFLTPQKKPHSMLMLD